MLEDFSERLKSIRKSKRMTQLDLSSAAGIARNTYSGYENGAYMPSAEVLVRIAAALGVSTDYLVSGKEEEKQATQPLQMAQVGAPLDIAAQLDLILFYLKNGGLSSSYKGHILTDDERALLVDYFDSARFILEKLSNYWKGSDNG